jgi:hypothetical protein
LGPGDLGFFPAGTSCIWRIPERVRKVAILRETMWLPLGVGIKVWKRIRRILRMPSTRMAEARNPI